MSEVYSYGACGSLGAIFQVLQNWQIHDGVNAIFPGDEHPTAVLYFNDDPIKNWIVVQAVPTSEGKVFIYRTIMVDVIPQDFTPAISIDVMVLPTFQDVLGELEDWFITSDMLGSSEQRSQIWSDTVKGLSALA